MTGFYVTKFVCVYCQEPATGEVFNTFGVSMGKYCELCAQKRLRELYSDATDRTMDDLENKLDDEP